MFFFILSPLSLTTAGAVRGRVWRWVCLGLFHYCKKHCVLASVELHLTWVHLPSCCCFFLKKGPKASHGLNQICFFETQNKQNTEGFLWGNQSELLLSLCNCSYLSETQSQTAHSHHRKTSTEYSPTGTLLRISVSIETAANPFWDTMQQLFGTGMYVHGMFWELFSLISQNQNSCQHTKMYKQRNQLGCQLSISRSCVFRKNWFFRQCWCSLLWATLQVIRRRQTNPGKAHSWGA